MKIILSRKSMDSSWGQMPSPIIKLKDGTHKILPFPIPSIKRKSSTKYSDLNLFNGFSAWDFIKLNKPKFENKYGEYCHLDPDLSESILNNRPQNWEVGFGQDHIAQSVLAKHNVTNDDIFLFFGWFQFAELSKGQYKFINNHEFPDGFHMIYAYLQIDKLYTVKEYYPGSLETHPHVEFHNNFEPHSQRNNTIYTATKILKNVNLDLRANGSNYFDFKENLILTKRAQTYRSIWDLPLSFHPNSGVRITYNEKEKNWSIENERAILKSAYRGQEFVCKSDPNQDVERWGINFIRQNNGNN